MTPIHAASWPFYCGKLRRRRLYLRVSGFVLLVVQLQDPNGGNDTDEKEEDGRGKPEREHAKVSMRAPACREGNEVTSLEAGPPSRVFFRLSPLRHAGRRADRWNRHGGPPGTRVGHLRRQTPFKVPRSQELRSGSHRCSLLFSPLPPPIWTFGRSAVRHGGEARRRSTSVDSCLGRARGKR